tara:strand:+ start:103 stop:582 length:480 start_codon:yes stop_codon:yes gene_type:complete
MNKEIIKSIVDDYFEIKIDNKTRKREYVEARFIYFKLLREFTNMSLNAIGSFVKRDHATVLYGVNQLETWMQYDNRIKTNYKAIRNMVVNYATTNDFETQNHNTKKEKIVILKKLEYEVLKKTLDENQEMIKTLIDEYKIMTDKYVSLQTKAKKYGFNL